MNHDDITYVKLYKRGRGELLCSCSLALLCTLRRASLMVGKDMTLKKHNKQYNARKQTAVSEFHSTFPSCRLIWVNLFLMCEKSRFAFLIGRYVSRNDFSHGKNLSENVSIYMINICYFPAGRSG